MGELLCLDLVQVEESLEVLPVPGGETLEVPLYQVERRSRCPCTRWRDAGGVPVPGLRTGDADEAGALPGAAGYPLGVGEVESVVGEVIHQVE